MRQTKRKKEILKILKDKQENNSVNDAIDILKNCPKVKFDQTIEISISLGIDPKKSDQQVRGTVTLPHGTGKKITLVVIAKGEKEKEAKEAGADYVGHDEIIEKIKNGWTDFNALIVTPDMMREVGKLGKVLGPRGLMPSPKSGTVTNDVTKAIKEVKAGKVEFKINKNGIINNVIGKLSFDTEKLKENFNIFVNAVNRSKPASSKGQFVKSVFLSSTMGPGLKIDLQSLLAN